MYSSLRNTTADWGYQIDRSNKAFKLMGNNVTWPMGKFIGGSAGMNDLFYVRGNQRDYDEWEQMGNPTWGWQSVLEYFKKIENFRGDNSTLDETLHGNNGLLNVNWFKNQNDFKRILFEAAAELGIKRLNDTNGNEFIGLGEAQGNIDQGTRCSPAKGYLIPAKDRPNLHVIKYAHVLKVNVDNTTGQVTGVTFSIQKTTELTATANKEVILSAGSIGTPQILQLSGIGPEKYLKRLNIPVNRNLKVGFSLQNHVAVPLFLKLNVTPSDNQAPNSLDNLYDYVRERKGILSEQNQFDVLGFFNAVNFTDAYPNIGTQYAIFRRNDIAGLDNYLKSIGFNDSIALPLAEVNKYSDIAIEFVTILNPVSLGKVRLRSADPYDLPVIQSNTLDHHEDLRSIVQGIQFVREFHNTGAFTQANVTEIKLDIPACTQIIPKKVKVKVIKSPKGKSKDKKNKKQKTETITEAKAVETILAHVVYGSDQYWECYAQHLTIPLYHPVGTAKMGPTTDPFAVVNSRLKVHGLNGLRVIDASIIPKILSGSTNAATVMIAEKGSDFIKEDWPEILDTTIPDNTSDNLTEDEEATVEEEQTEEEENGTEEEWIRVEL